MKGKGKKDVNRREWKGFHLFLSHSSPSFTILPMYLSVTLGRLEGRKWRVNNMLLLSCIFLSLHNTNTSILGYVGVRKGKRDRKIKDMLFLSPFHFWYHLIGRKKYEKQFKILSDCLFLVLSLNLRAETHQQRRRKYENS